LAANWRAISAPSPEDAPVIRIVDMSPSLGGIGAEGYGAESADWMTTTLPMILSASVCFLPSQSGHSQPR
jgi:hypothetical protein